MDFAPDSIMVSLVVGIVGLALFRYGKKEERAPQLLGGLALMIYPMFVRGAGAMLAVGGGIVAAIVLAISAGY